jgi:hypothetical protein
VNLFNRGILVLLCLALIGGSAAIAGLAWAAPEESIDWLADAAVWLENHNTDGTKILITIGGILVGLVGLIVLVVELLPRRKTEVKVTGLQVGDAVLTTAAIGQRIEEAVNQVPNVADVRATVQAKRKGVLVNLDLHVDPQANLAAVTDEACEAARDILNEKVHVELLAPPRARLHYREMRLQGRGSRRGAVAAAVPAEVGAPTVEPVPAAIEEPASEPADPEAETLTYEEQAITLEEIPEVEATGVVEAEAADTGTHTRTRRARV